MRPVNNDKPRHQIDVVGDGADDLACTVRLGLDARGRMQGQAEHQAKVKPSRPERPGGPLSDSVLDDYLAGERLGGPLSPFSSQFWF